MSMGVQWSSKSMLEKPQVSSSNIRQNDSPEHHKTRNPKDAFRKKKNHNYKTNPYSRITAPPRNVQNILKPLVPLRQRFKKISKPKLTTDQKHAGKTRMKHRLGTPMYHIPLATKEKLLANSFSFRSHLEGLGYPKSIPHLFDHYAKCLSTEMNSSLVLIFLHNKESNELVNYSSIYLNPDKYFTRLNNCSYTDEPFRLYPESRFSSKQGFLSHILRTSSTATWNTFRFVEKMSSQYYESILALPFISYFSSSLLDQRVFHTKKKSIQRKFNDARLNKRNCQFFSDTDAYPRTLNSRSDDICSTRCFINFLQEQLEMCHWKKRRYKNKDNMFSLRVKSKCKYQLGRRNSIFTPSCYYNTEKVLLYEKKRKNSKSYHPKDSSNLNNKVPIFAENISGSGYTSDSSYSISNITFHKKKKGAVKKAFWEVVSEKKTKVQQNEKPYKDREQASTYHKKLPPSRELPFGSSNDSFISNWSSDTVKSNVHCDILSQNDINTEKNNNAINIMDKKISACVESKCDDSLYDTSDFITEKLQLEIQKREQWVHSTRCKSLVTKTVEKENKNQIENNFSTVATKPRCLNFSKSLQALDPFTENEFEQKTNKLCKYPVRCTVYRDDEMRRYSSQTVAECSTQGHFLVPLTKTKNLLTPCRYIKSTYDPNTAFQLNDKKEWSHYFAALMRKRKRATIPFPCITLFSRVLFHINRSEKSVPLAIICVAKPFFINPNSKTSLISQFLLNSNADATQSWMHNILQVDFMRRKFIQQKCILRLHRNLITGVADTKTSVIFLLSFMKKLTNASDAALFIVDRATKQFVCCESNERKCIGFHLKFTDKILGSCYFHKVPQRFISSSIVQRLDAVNMTRSDLQRTRIQEGFSCHNIPKHGRVSKTVSNLNVYHSAGLVYRKAIGAVHSHFDDGCLRRGSDLKPEYGSIARSATKYDVLKNKSCSHSKTLPTDNSLSRNISLLKLLGSINLSYDLVSESTVTRSVICLPVLNYNQDVMAIILVMNKYHKSYKLYEHSNMNSNSFNNESHEKEKSLDRHFPSGVLGAQKVYSPDYKTTMGDTQSNQLEKSKTLFHTTSFHNLSRTQEVISPRRYSAPLQKVCDKTRRDDTHHTPIDKMLSISELTNTKNINVLKSENTCATCAGNALKKNILHIPSRLQNYKICGSTDGLKDKVVTQALDKRVCLQQYNNLKYVIPFSHEDTNLLTALVNEIAQLRSNEFQYTYLDILHPFPLSGHVQYFGAVSNSLVSPKNLNSCMTKRKSVSKNSANKDYYPSVNSMLKTIKKESRLKPSSVSPSLMNIFSTNNPIKICTSKTFKTSTPEMNLFSPVEMLKSNTLTNQKTVKTRYSENIRNKKKAYEIEPPTLPNLVFGQKMKGWITHQMVLKIIHRLKNTSGRRLNFQFRTICSRKRNNLLSHDLWKPAKQRISYTDCIQLSSMIQKEKYYNSLYCQNLLKKKVLDFDPYKNSNGNVNWNENKLLNPYKLSNECFKATCLVVCKPRQVPSLSNVKVIFCRRRKKRTNQKLFRKNCNKKKKNSAIVCKSRFQNRELTLLFNKKIEKNFRNKYCLNLLKLQRRFNSNNKKKRLKDIVLKQGIGWWDYSCAEILSFFMDSLRSFNLDTVFISEAYPKLELFFYAIAKSYHAENPYHNFFHAIQIVWLLLHHYNCSKYLNAVEILATLLGALCHDVDHPGFNNEYLITTSHATALIYNDISVLENHHCSFSFRLLERFPELDFRFALDEKDRRTFRHTFIQGILATDMRCHTSKLQQISNRIQRHYSGTELLSSNNEDDRRMVTEMVLHAADISNPLVPPPYHRCWASLIVEEFNLQCDQEMYIGLNPTPFMNCRTEKSRIDCQVKFLNFIVIPLWKTVALLLPSVEKFVRQGECNVSKWQRYLRNLQLAEESQDPKTPVKSKFNFSYSTIRHRHP